MKYAQYVVAASTQAKATIKAVNQAHVNLTKGKQTLGNFVPEKKLTLGEPLELRPPEAERRCMMKGAAMTSLRLLFVVVIIILVDIHFDRLMIRTRLHDHYETRPIQDWRRFESTDEVVAHYGEDASRGLGQRRMPPCAQ
jgi:hypothetical protein